MNLKDLNSESIKKFNSFYFNTGDPKLTIEYAPFDVVRPNTSAKVIFVGLTPGRQQADASDRILKECLNGNKSLDEFERLFRAEVAFTGSMRNNLIEMLNKICIGPRKNESLGHLKVRGQINIENTDRLIWSTSSIT